MTSTFRDVRREAENVVRVYDNVEVKSEPTDREMSAALVDWNERKVKEVVVPSGVPKLYMKIVPEGRAKAIREMGYGVFHKYDQRSQKNYQPNAYLVIPEDDVPNDVSRWHRKMGEQFPDVEPEGGREPRSI